MITVQNGRDWGFIGRDKIYIGRKCTHGKYDLPQSPLANPFYIGKDGDRTEVNEKFRRWLWPQIKAWRETGELSPAIALLKSIAIDVVDRKPVILTCWCKPEPCHGDVIASCVNWIIQEGLV